MSEGRPAGYVGPQRDPNLPEGAKHAPFGTDSQGWPKAPHGWIMGGRYPKKAPGAGSADPEKPARPGGTPWQKATVPPAAKVDLAAAAATAAKAQATAAAERQAAQPAETTAGQPQGDGKVGTFGRCHTCNTGVDACRDCGRLQTPPITASAAQGPVMLLKIACSKMGEPLEPKEEAALLAAIVETANFLRLFSAWVPFVLPALTIAAVMGPRVWRWWQRRKTQIEPAPTGVPGTAVSTAGAKPDVRSEPRPEPRPEPRVLGRDGAALPEAGGFAV